MFLLFRVVSLTSEVLVYCANLQIWRPMQYQKFPPVKYFQHLKKCLMIWCWTLQLWSWKPIIPEPGFRKGKSIITNLVLFQDYTISSFRNLHQVDCIVEGIRQYIPSSSFGKPEAYGVSSRPLDFLIPIWQIVPRWLYIYLTFQPLLKYRLVFRKIYSKDPFCLNSV